MWLYFLPDFCLISALIIEEIAIDDSEPARTTAYLNLARDLHMESLTLCERVSLEYNSLLASGVLRSFP